jgi:hypothetical protein
VLVEAAGEKALALVATGSLDGSMRVWRAHVDGTASCVAVCAGHEGSVEALASTQGNDGGRVRAREALAVRASTPRTYSATDSHTSHSSPRALPAPCSASARERLA